MIVQVSPVSTDLQSQLARFDDEKPCPMLAYTMLGLAL
jgi:hypothetical protein